MALFLTRAADKAGIDLGDAMDMGFADLGMTGADRVAAINVIAAAMHRPELSGELGVEGIDRAAEPQHRREEAPAQSPGPPRGWWYLSSRSEPQRVAPDARQPKPESSQLAPSLGRLKSYRRHVRFPRSEIGSESLVP